MVSAGLLTIYGCGGGGSSGGALTISGTAATGAAIANGTVSVKCATGTGTATTNSDGTYTVTISGGTAPCLLKATATDAKGVTTDLYSAVEAGQTTANITPLTQLVIANALGSDPATVFAAGLSNSNVSNLSSTSLSTAVGKVQTVLTSYGVDLTGVDPLKATLIAATENAAGNALDQKIDGLMVALKSAGVTLATVTNVVKDSTKSASTLTTDLGTAAPNLTTSSLNNCPVARSGSYFYAAPGDTTLNKVVINFAASGSNQTIDSQSLAPLSGWDVANSLNFTIAPVSGTPCSYAFTLNGATFPIHVRVSASGVGAFGLNGTNTVTNATTVVSGAVNAGLILPIQRHWTRANLVGTIYSLHYSKVRAGYTGFGTNAPGLFVNFYTKFKVENSGTTASAWRCADLTSCPADNTAPDSTYSIAGPDADGVFTFTDTVNSVASKVTVYQTASGDTVVMGINATASNSLASNFFVMSDRVSGYPGRTVSQTWSNTNWQLKYSSGVPSLETNTNSFVATTADAVAKFFTRQITDNFNVVKTDKITWNNPLNGMIKRTENSAVAHNFIGFTGVGWTVYVSDTPGGGSDTAATLKANNFMGFSINPI